MAALHKGLKRRCSIHNGGLAEVIAGGILYLCLCCRAVDLGEPCNALGAGHGHAVSKNAERLAAVFSRFFTDDHALVPGAAAACFYGIEGIFSRIFKSVLERALHIGAAKLRACAVTVHPIDICARNGCAICIRYGQLGRHSGNRLLAVELIVRF